MTMEDAYAAYLRKLSEHSRQGAKITKRKLGPFRRDVEALPVGGRMFVKLPDGMEMKLHQRRCSARKALSQREGRKYATRRGEHEGRRGIWIERVS